MSSFVSVKEGVVGFGSDGEAEDLSLGCWPVPELRSPTRISASSSAVRRRSEGIEGRARDFADKERGFDAEPANGLAVGTGLPGAVLTTGGVILITGPSSSDDAVDLAP